MRISRILKPSDVRWAAIEGLILDIRIVEVAIPEMKRELGKGT